MEDESFTETQRTSTPSGTRPAMDFKSRARGIHREPPAPEDCMGAVMEEEASRATIQTGRECTVSVSFLPGLASRNRVPAIPAR